MAVLNCASCGAEREVPDKYAGKKVRCPDCAGPVRIPLNGVPPDADPGFNLDGPMPTATGFEDQPRTAYFNCPSCQYVRPVPGDLLGRQARCPQCKGAGSVDAEPLSWAGLPTEEEVNLDDLAQVVATGAYCLLDDRRPDDRRSDDTRRAAAESSLAEAEAAVRGPRVHLLGGNPGKNLAAGLATGLLTVFFCLALAVLVFPHHLEAGHFGHIFGATLGAAALAGLVISLRSRIPFAVGAPESVSFAGLFVLTNALYVHLNGVYPDQAVYVTIWAGVALTALTGALVAFLLALSRGGGWVRFMPVQILGGVFGALGLVLFRAAFLLVTGRDLTLSLIRETVLGGDLAGLVEQGVYWAWLPAFALGLLLFLVFRRRRHALGLLLFLVAVCAGAWAVRQYAPAAVADRVWAGPTLAYAFNPDTYLSFFSAGVLDQIQWPVLVDHMTLFAALGVLMVVSLLYKGLLLEERLDNDADLDKKLQVFGAANALVGLAGGPPVGISLGRSLGARNFGARGPVAGLTAALVAGAAVVYSGTLLPLVPTLVPAGLLVFFGLKLLYGWLVSTRNELTRREDYYLLWITFLGTVFLGLVIGIGIGLLFTLLLTVSRFSKAGAVKHVLSGAHHRSNVDRAPAQLKVLKAHGDVIYVVRLRGFVFLGTFHSVVSLVLQRLRDVDKSPLKYLVVDFGYATGLGSSVGHGFARLLRLGRSAGLTVICTAVPFEVEEGLERSGLIQTGSEHSLRLFVNLDFAMEWCENNVLDEHGVLEIKGKALPELLAPVFPDPALIPTLMKTLQKVKIKRKEYVFYQGEDSDSMYFVASGSLTVELGLPDGKTIRLKKMGPGAVFGEMGIFTTAPRSASIRADEASVVYRLSKERLELVRTRLPSLYSAISRYLVTMLSERVVDANAMIRDLSR